MASIVFVDLVARWVWLPRPCLGPIAVVPLPEAYLIRRAVTGCGKFVCVSNAVHFMVARECEGTFSDNVLLLILELASLGRHGVEEVDLVVLISTCGQICGGPSAVDYSHGMQLGVVGAAAQLVWNSTWAWDVLAEFVVPEESWRAEVFGITSVDDFDCL